MYSSMMYVIGWHEKTCVWQLWFRQLIVHWFCRRD